MLYKYFHHLENRFGIIKRSIDPKISADLNTGATACVKRSIHNSAKQSLLFDKIKFINRKKHLSGKHNCIKMFYFMPCNLDDETLSRYTVTHEYGHMLENVLISSDDQSFKVKTKQIRDEITDIAKQIDKKYDESKYLSVYGATNNREIFAECFAYSQLGNPNILGYAMQIWFERNGF